MIIERIVYCLVCLILFGYIVNKYLKSKSGIYLSLLAIQLVCMITQLIAFFTKIYVDIFMQIYIFIFNILVPAAILGSEYLNINFEEFLEIKIGDFYARRNKYDKAIEKYKKAIAKNSNNASTFAKLGRIYNAKGDRRTAFERFARAIEIDRNDYRSYYEIGVIFNDMGKQADAQIVLDNSLRIKPDFTPASELLAVVLCAQNKYDEAINVYKNATRYDPDNYQLYYSMGVVRTELRDFNDAKSCYEKVIELNPSLYQAYFSLGQINLLKGELDQAEKMFKKAMVSKELTAKSYYQLAKVYILNDEEIKAVTYLGYAIDIDSSYKYKAESEPLFAKIKDYITGLSMANKVMQQAENIESLKRTEEKSKNTENNEFENRYSAVNEKVESKNDHTFDDKKSSDNTLTIKKSEEKNIEKESYSPREKLAAETRRIVEEEAKTNENHINNKTDYDVEEPEKENKFMKMFKKVLGFDTENGYESESEEVEQEIKEKNYRNETSKTSYLENFGEFDDHETAIADESNENEKREYYSDKFNDDKYDVDVNKDVLNNERIYKETEAVGENTSTLDIFEKFKKLKKEEDEKAEKLRRMQKMKQLEDLKQQSKQNENQENLNYKANIDNDYYEDDTPVVVRTVGNSDSEDARRELKRLEELRKLRNFELQRDDRKTEEFNTISTVNVNDIEKMIETQNSMKVKNVEENSYSSNENFEDEDTMDEPHFDFMDRFKRK